MRMKMLFRLGLGVAILMLVVSSLWSTIVTEQAVTREGRALALYTLYEHAHEAVNVEGSQVALSRSHPSSATRERYQQAATSLTQVLLTLARDGDQHEGAFAQQAQVLHNLSRSATEQWWSALDSGQPVGLAGTDQRSIQAFVPLQRLVNSATTQHLQRAQLSQEELRAIDQAASVVTLVAIGSGLALFLTCWFLLGTYHFRVEQVVLIDALTTLPNHRAIMERLQAEVAQCQQAQQTCSIMFVDLDRFKHINDTWGHLAGDAVLREVGKRLQATLHPHGMVGRYGGEEFAAVLKGVTIEQAIVIAEQVRAAIAAAACLWQAGDSPEEVRLPVTASIGVAAYGLHGTSTQALLERADRAMYLAKQKRNLVCVADVESEKEQVSPLEEREQSGPGSRSLLSYASGQ